LSEVFLVVVGIFNEGIYKHLLKKLLFVFELSCQLLHRDPQNCLVYEKVVEVSDQLALPLLPCIRLIFILHFASAQQVVPRTLRSSKVVVPQLLLLVYL